MLTAYSGGRLRAADVAPAARVRSALWDDLKAAEALARPRQRRRP